MRCERVSRFSTHWRRRVVVMKPTCCTWGWIASGAAILSTAAALCFTLGGCKQDNPSLKWVKLPAELTVEIARTSEERERGLMYRQHLPRGQGMYFVFEEPQPRSFYMRDTRIPLSIAFIRSDGIIESIKNMIPLDVRSVYSNGPVQFALEANRGWFEEHGIRPGDRVVLKNGRISFFRRTGSAIEE